MYVVVYLGYEIDGVPRDNGPFNTEGDCYAFAGRISQEPNDWAPVQLTAPDKVVEVEF